MRAFAPRRGLSGSALKLIAIVCMTADHCAWVFFPGYDRAWGVMALHLIGRIAAPIMWFFVSEGAYHTRSLRRYTLRLFLLAVVSHFAYCFCFDIPFLPFRQGIFNQTSVVWTLFVGLMLIRLHQSSRFRPWQQTVLTLLLCAAALPADWSCAGCMAILLLAGYRGALRRQMCAMLLCTAAYGLVFALFQDAVYGALQLGVALAVPLLCLYDGRKGGGRWMQPFFYVYYPAHLLLLGVIR